MMSRPGDQAPEITQTDPATILDQQFTEVDLVGLRQAVAAHADNAGLNRSQVYQLTLVAYELATNAVRHGGGSGRLLLWRAGGSVHCQVSDSGPGLPPDFRLPQQASEPGALGGRGLWLASQLSDALTFADEGTGATLTVEMHGLVDNTAAE